MKIGDKIRVTKCDACPKVVGKTATVTAILSGGERPESVVVNFGRGRPQNGRPNSFSVNDVSLDKE
jgi:hypothetical protein